MKVLKCVILIAESELYEGLGVYEESSNTSHIIGDTSYFIYIIVLYYYLDVLHINAHKFRSAKQLSVFSSVHSANY